MKTYKFSRSKFIFSILIFSFLVFLSEYGVCEQTTKRDYWPTNGWKTSTPEMQGMDFAKLLTADEFIENRLPDVFSLLVVKSGYLVFEKYYSWGSPDKYPVVHSVTKSFISALIGKALDMGYIDNLDQKLSEFFSEYITDESDPRKKRSVLDTF